MLYLELNLDPFISLENVIQSPLTNPLNLISYVESIGVPGISFTYNITSQPFSEISTLRALTNSRLNIRVAADLQAVQKAILLKPDMITLIDPESETQTLELPSKSVTEILNIISKNNDLNFALRMEPNVKQLKEAYQAGANEVELSTNQLAFEKNHAGFYEVLESIIHNIRVAKKNNLRISLGGNLDRRLILALKEVADVEFVSVDYALLSQSLIRGFENALREFTQLVENK